MKPTDILKEEHRAIERALDVLEKSAVKVGFGEKVLPEVFRGTIRFLQQFADGCHHAKEEDLLFPALERSGFSRDSGPVAVMLTEHEEGRFHVRALAQAIDRLEQHDPEAPSLISRHATAFASLLRSHILKEDHILFVMADARLSAGEQQRLHSDFEETENSQETGLKKKELLSLLAHLEQSIKKEETVL